MPWPNHQPNLASAFLIHFLPVPQGYHENQMQYVKTFLKLECSKNITIILGFLC
jgi:hypothetical protein